MLSSNTGRNTSRGPVPLSLIPVPDPCPLSTVAAICPCPGRLVLRLSSGRGIAGAGTNSRDGGRLQGQGQMTVSSGRPGGSGSPMPGRENS